MKSIHFKEVTNKVAENQEQFNTIHVQFNPNEMSQNVCFELEDSEVAEIIRTKKIWYKQVTNGKPMNPFRISPFKNQMIQTRKQIKHIEDIDVSTPEGEMLFASLVPLTTETHKDKTPDEVLEILNKIKNTIPFAK